MEELVKEARKTGIDILSFEIATEVRDRIDKGELVAEEIKKIFEIVDEAKKRAFEKALKL
jgi:hypothetical protein